MRAAILQGWSCNQIKLWHIPLVKHVQNNNSKAVLCGGLPTEFLPEQPPPTKAIANIYKLKVQPELVCYYHAAAGFPNKPTWVMAIKNRQFALWPGLAAKAVTEHFTELKRRQKEMAKDTKRPPFYKEYSK
jgi:hypothetical protein